MGDFPPTRPLSCPACGSAQSETGGRSKSNPPPSTSSMGISRHLLPEGRKSDTPEAPPEVDGGGYCTGTLISPLALPINGLPGTPMLGPRHTTKSVRACVVFPNGSLPPPSSLVRMPPWSVLSTHNMVGMPYVLFLPHWYIVSTDQTTPSVHGNLIGASSP